MQSNQPVSTCTDPMPIGIEKSRTFLGPAGDKHLFGTGMMEGGGGPAIASLRMKHLTITSWTIVDPSSPEQDGFWILDPSAPWGAVANPMSLWDKGDFGYEYVSSLIKRNLLIPTKKL